MQYAVLLSNICKKVYIVTWMNKFFGDKALEKVMKDHGYRKDGNAEWIK